MTVPALRPERRYFVVGWGYLVWSFLYLSCGYAGLAEPTVLPATALDHAIPYVGWTIWLYISQFHFLCFALWVLDEKDQLNKVLYSMLVANAISFSVFLPFPTVFPAETVPATGLTEWTIGFIDALDSTSNYFPSLHVSLALLAAWGVARRRRSLAPLAFGWALLIILSTMTTKKHCAIDVAAGAVVAVVSRSCAVRMRYVTA